MSTTRQALTLVLLTLAASGCSTTRVASAPEEPFPLEQYKQARIEARDRVSQLIKEYSPRLRTGTVEQQRQAMKETASFLADHLAQHPEQVEPLYTFADRQVGPRYTETMRYEHKQLGSDISYLRTLADAAEPDVARFRSRLSAYIACMSAHLDTEEMTIGAQVVEHEMDRRKLAEAK